MKKFHILMKPNDSPSYVQYNRHHLVVGFSVHFISYFCNFNINASFCT